VVEDSQEFAYRRDVSLAPAALALNTLIEVLEEGLNRLAMSLHCKRQVRASLFPGLVMCPECSVSSEFWILGHQAEIGGEPTGIGKVADIIDRTQENGLADRMAGLTGPILLMLIKFLFWPPFLYSCHLPRCAFCCRNVLDWQPRRYPLRGHFHKPASPDNEVQSRTQTG